MSDKIREALQGMLDIVDDSEGVAGYHRNGVIAEWHDFPEVDVARAALTQQPAPPASEQPDTVKVGREQIARAIWNVLREYEDRCDMELEDMPRGSKAWEAADAVRALLSGGDKP